MTIDDVYVDQRVRLPDDPDPGVVERIDRDEYIVWVRYPLPNGQTDLIDIDPGDLEPWEDE